jgi:hypothetical protein
MTPVQPQSVAVAARTLLRHSSYGVLSTHSRDLPGYPFGSVVTFATDEHGEVIVSISTLAQHTANIARDPKVSLTLMETADDPQAGARLTLIADAEPLTAAEAGRAAERYLRRFPAAMRHQETHDFLWYRLRCRRARYIGGFGRIHWVEAADLILPNPFANESERAMCHHMDDDHIEALRDLCYLAGEVLNERDTPQMAGIDAEGCEVRAGKKLLQFDFLSACTTAAEVRVAIVRLARIARMRAMRQLAEGAAVA